MRILPFLFAVLLLVSCSKENEEEEIPVSNGPSVSSPYEMLNYDAGNMDAPLLGSGTFESAAKFGSVEIGSNVGARITKVWFYLKELPSTCELRIYQANAGANSPDSVLYNVDLSSVMEAGRWNNHELADTINIPNKDVWVSIRYTHTNDTRSLGCDPGPAVNNGDVLWTSTGGNWITLRQYDGTNINWNIRTVILP